MYGPITTSSKGLYSDAKLDACNQVVQDMLENQNIEVVRWTPDNLELIKHELELVRRLVMTSV